MCDKLGVLEGILFSFLYLINLQCKPVWYPFDPLTVVVLIVQIILFLTVRISHICVLPLEKSGIKRL